MNVNDIHVAFDCECLLHDEPELEGKPRYLTIDLFHTLQDFGLNMIIWSTSGTLRAEAVKTLLGLYATIMEIGSIKPDIAIANEVVTLGKVNINMDGENEEVKVCFDIHGSLVHDGDPDFMDDKGFPLEGTPRYSVIKLYEAFENLGCSMYIWTSHGKEEAEKWKTLLGLHGTPMGKKSNFADIAIDNKDFDLGKVCIPV